MTYEACLQAAARCWCQEKTKDKVMDIDLCEAVARAIEEAYDEGHDQGYIDGYDEASDDAIPH